MSRNARRSRRLKKESSLKDRAKGVIQYVLGHRSHQSCDYVSVDVLEKLKKLIPDQNQLQFIQQSHEKNLIVNSCPGSGKTTWLVLRVIYFISEGKLPNSIVVLTFTKKGMSEFKTYFMDLMQTNDPEVTILGPSDMPRFFTFHKFATKYLIEKHNTRSDEVLDFITETELQTEIKKIKKSLLLKNLTHQEIQRIIRESRYTVETNRGNISSLPSYDSQRIYTQYKRFLDRKKLEKKYDFTGLLLWLQKELAQHGLCNDISYLLVDEAQDTDKFMFAIIKEMARGLQSITCVGDDWQEIFSYSGLSIEDFGGVFGSVMDQRRTIKVELTKNYRCNVNIQKVISAVKSGKTPSSLPAGYQSRVLSFSSVTTLTLQEQYDTVHYWTRKILQKNKKVYILFRRNWEKEVFDTYIKTKNCDWVDHVGSGRVTVEVSHKVKGGEADVVFMLNVFEMNVPLYREVDANPLDNPFGETLEQKIKSERRLFYVSVSRARDFVILLQPTILSGQDMAFKNWAVKSTWKSQFVDQLGILVKLGHEHKDIEKFFGNYL